MLLVVGLAVADARPLVLGGQVRSDALVASILAAGLGGTLLARSHMGLLRAHVIGAAVGAALLLLVAAAAAADGGPPLVLDGEVLRERLQALSGQVEAELGRFLGEAQTPPAISTFMLLGALCWATGQFSAFSVFRHRRAGPAVMASGLLLVLNEALPPLEPAVDRLTTLPTLALFSVLAMLLLVRLQLTAQSRHWLRRHIADTGEVRPLVLRTGTLFVILVVGAAASLTAIARVPAQSIDYGALEAPWEGLRAEIRRWLSLVAVDVTPRATTTFGDRLEVADVWDQGSGVAFEAEVDAGLRGNYWWLSAFADFDGHSWSRHDTTTGEVPALEDVAIPADASGAGPLEVVASVTPRKSALAQGTVLGPSESLRLSRDVRVRSLGDDEGLTEITFVEEVLRGGSYTVASAVHDYEVSSGSLTAWGLRAAGTDYPAWMGRYLRIEAGASGPRTAGLADDLATLAAEQGLESPYDLARLLQDRLRTMAYATSIVGLCGVTENVPECLLRTETGFCQQFASTMVMVLRELQIPARLVNGYLPGTRTADGSYEVPMQALHAWVEVYFPGTGWLRFDPTPGEQLRRYEQQPTRFAEGEPGASPGPQRSVAPGDAVENGSPSAEPSAAPTAGSSTGGGDGQDAWAVLLGAAGLAMLALLAAVSLLLVRLRRLPGADGSLAWRRISGLAARLGHGPQPSQTEYEYAARLSEALPSVREDLYVVAHARVEQRYGRREAPSERRAMLRAAYARIRVALLRLGWKSRR
jgi:transglutaminase-like putative cysteine protease